MSSTEPFVISGISGRYPESRNLEEFWKNLLEGKELGTIDRRRWDLIFPNVPNRVAKILDVELFDAEFFRIPIDVSNRMFTCLRTLHEVVYEALIDSGFEHNGWEGIKTGFSIGTCVFDEYVISDEGASSIIENVASYLSYTFNFKGPICRVDTACAASSSAMDIALQNIKNGNCDQMLVVGFNLCISPMVSASFKAFGMINMEGRSKCLDVNADGYCKSESIVAILIQRKSDAKRIYGSLSHVASNCDGYTEEGITFPRYDAQYKLLSSLFNELKLNPLDINYVEGHITGTQAGDPVECASILATVRPDSDKPLLVGCLKSNVGHSEGSATLNAVSKVVKIFQTGIIPANINYKEPNPKIDGLVKGILKPVLKNTKFDDDSILVNAFGFGGVNNSFVLRANPKRVKDADKKLSDKNIPRLVTFCNRTASGLDVIVDYLNEQRGSITKYTLGLVNSLSKTKPSSGFNHRGYGLLNNEQLLIQTRFNINLPSEELETLFVFTPMFNVPPQWISQLLDVPFVYSRLKEMETETLRALSINVIQMVESEQRDITSFLVSSIAIQIALSDLLIKHLDVKPKGFIGHSIGFIVAAYADGCITEEDALLIGYHISRACKSPTCIKLPKEQEGIQTNLFESNSFSTLLERALDSIEIELEKFLKPSKANSSTLKSTSLPWNTDETPISPRTFVDCLKSSNDAQRLHQHIQPNSCLIHFGPSDDELFIGDEVICLFKESANDSEYRPAVISLYNAVGDIYLKGLNPKIENLYESVEYPVPRETQSISHLIRWKHDVKRFVLKFEPEKSFRPSMFIEIMDPNHRYIEGHKVEGRILCPATGYLYIAWHLICSVHHVELNEQPIEFSQIRFLRATQFNSMSASATFKLKFNRDKETFLLYGNEISNVCVSGNYRLVQKPSIYLTDQDRTSAEGEDELVLETEDIYKDFRIRGYDYSGAFRGIHKASSNGAWARIKDTGHWVGFADSCCQVTLFAAKKMRSVVPIYMDYVYMDPYCTKSAFKDQLNRLEPDSVNCLDVYFDRFTGTVQTKGFIVKGIIGQELKRKMLNANVRISVQKPLPFKTNPELSTDEMETIKSYSNDCMRLIKMLKDWSECHSTESEEKEFEAIGDQLNRNGESNTLGQILFETIKLMKSEPNAVHEDGRNSKLNDVYDLHSDTLVKDLLFMKPLQFLGEIMMNIVNFNVKTRTSSIIALNFRKIPSEIEFARLRAVPGFLFTTEYALVDTIANELSIDGGSIKVSSTSTRISEAKSYDVVIVRDKSTYLMLRDTDHGVKCNQFESTLQLAFNSLKEGGFCLVLTRTKLTDVEHEWQQLIGNNQKINFDEASIKKVATRLGFFWVTCKELEMEGYCSILLIRPRSVDSRQTNTFIRVGLNDLKWFEQIKEAVKDKDQTIWLIGGGHDNGIVGLTGCLMKEFGDCNIRCYYDPSKGDDEEIIVPNDVLERDLTLNVVGPSGVCGVYESLPIDIDEVKVETSSCYADSQSRGDLSSLRWFQSMHSNWDHIPKEKFKYDLDKVTIYYGSLNFKDVLIATGRLPSLTICDNEYSKAHTIGLEYSGIDESGRRVMGICDAGGIGTSIVTNSEWAKIPVPDGWTLAEAATVPMVHLTAYYGLCIRGKLLHGESVLIHAGSGGVGQAAISICLARGCEVFTTVGTQEKREFIKKRFPAINDEHIGDSRSTSFEEMIMRMTDGRGVDLVLNSLTEDKTRASMRCLADFGRFIEVGKFDMVMDTQIDPQTFDNDKTFHACCLGFLQEDVIFNKIPERKKLWDELINMLTEGIKLGEVTPLPMTIFRMDQLEESFRFMATGKHIGKVLIQMRDETEDPNALKLYPAVGQTFFDPEKSYIITGGLGGLGLEVAHWIGQRGATNLVLTSRSGIKNKYQENLLKRIKNNVETHTNIIISNEDCQTFESVERLIKQAEELGRIGGIFHLAMVLKDGLFEKMTIEEFEVAVKPKAFACRHLDQLTRSLPYNLDYFVCFSSVSAEIGNPGQSNYNFGNVSMENVCEKRRRDGLHGCAIRWGKIGDVGALVDSQTKTNEIMNALSPMRLPQVLHIMDKLLCTPDAVITAYLDADSVTSLPIGVSLKITILNVLGIKDHNKVDPNSTLSELGLDSLMAVEIKQTLETEYNHVMTTQEIRNLKVSELNPLEEKIRKNLDETKVSREFKEFSNIKSFIEIPTEIFVQLTDIKSRSLFYFPHINNSFESIKPIFTSSEKSLIGINWVKEVQKLTTVDEMIAFYVDALTKNYPNERGYNLIGYSFGGVIALHVAIELQKRIGYNSVRNLILLDISPDVLIKRGENVVKRVESKDEDTSKVLRAIEFVSQFIQLLSWNEIKDKLLSLKSQQERYQLITDIINQKTSSELNAGEVQEASEFYFSKQEIIQQMSVKDKFYGDVTLIRATDTTNDIDAEGIDELELEDYGLSKYVSGIVNVRQVPGNHSTFMDNNPNLLSDVI